MEYKIPLVEAEELIKKLNIDKKERMDKKMKTIKDREEKEKKELDEFMKRK